jgi:hypothetical protein
MLTLDQLLVEVSLDRRGVNLRDLILAEERQQMLTQLPLVVCLSFGTQALRRARRPPS